MAKRQERLRRTFFRYAAGIAAPALCTALTWPLRHSLGPASILMIYLLGVFLVATRHGRGASILASLLSAPAFAYFYAPPIFSLVMADSENIIGLLVMLLVANVTSGLVERIGSQAAIAAQAEAEALRNSLLSAISHDLRTPLTRIVGTAGTLAEQDSVLTPAERQEFTLAIQDEAQRMADLMSKILDMARLSAGKIVLHQEWNALEEIVGGTLTRLDGLLQERPVSIHLPENLPLLWVDAVLLQQVLMNLIENAVKYTPDGSPIDISAACLPAGLRVAVADRGPGIAEGQRERLFEKFYRMAPESAQSGVGLGLALCRAIVAAHGGAIGVEPRDGGGAVFFLTLQLHEQPPALPWDESAEVKA
ncbi:MAG: DUF4118 domain-containing protein [Methylococcaceae bacterium]|nr:MAG: DUF4118 domain-containing protein [Methylococcaceae bacterium]